MGDQKGKMKAEEPEEALNFFDGYEDPVTNDEEIEAAEAEAIIRISRHEALMNPPAYTPHEGSTQAGPGSSSPAPVPSSSRQGGNPSAPTIYSKTISRPSPHPASQGANAGSRVPTNPTSSQASGSSSQTNSVPGASQELPPNPRARMYSTPADCVCKCDKVAYVVFHGRKTGVYFSWDEVEDLVRGYKGARYRGYHTEADAWHAWYQALDMGLVGPVRRDWTNHHFTIPQNTPCTEAREARQVEVTATQNPTPSPQVNPPPPPPQAGLPSLPSTRAVSRHSPSRMRALNCALHPSLDFMGGCSLAFGPSSSALRWETVDIYCASWPWDIFPLPTGLASGE
ncbi:hypothetical protein NP233_g8059 [Leucocoprinus birnbaumii]|uniref:Ribonuclease H1 N-terminal domain-containing protein n=1 Tax=Leucocoprinus birnbaumii TaxID=56174 RepID=A0AAD5VN48_9AGAR|nr:hypothetical protein NP233_g8059 [Leucocoprinus birnbaumii]